MKIIAIEGLPGSGKSTWVSEQIKEPGVVRVESDMIRRMLHGEQWIAEYEDTVHRIRLAAIVSLLSEPSPRFHTIIDDECGYEDTFNQLRKLASVFGAEFEVKSFLHIPIEECIRRDSLRPEGKRVGEGVIRKKAEGYGI